MEFELISHAVVLPLKQTRPWRLSNLFFRPQIAQIYADQTILKKNMRKSARSAGENLLIQCCRRQVLDK